MAGIGGPFRSSFATSISSVNTNGTARRSHDTWYKYVGRGHWFLYAFFFGGVMEWLLDVLIGVCGCRNSASSSPTLRLSDERTYLYVATVTAVVSSVNIGQASLQHLLSPLPLILCSHRSFITGNVLFLHYLHSLLLAVLLTWVKSFHSYHL